MIGARVKLNRPHPEQRDWRGTITRWSPSGVWCYVKWDNAKARKHATSRLIEIDEEDEA